MAKSTVLVTGAGGRIGLELVLLVEISLSKLAVWEMMKSAVADMVNTGGRQGGAIIAVLFLKQYVDEKVQWMHIDIAGPVWSEKMRSATGFGISTMVRVGSEELMLDTA
ncbi:hypothetical protein WN943_029753 [Citrus x changshan-huyou]|uniref:Uncharacterized protein n=2 Tax=Citrus sinensis TaxID=2711 RepID=A0ACB8I0K4_CITSI|nr:hypothetical protein KPL71_026593 [Citrus sinensis]KAH9680560.1 hypothetical protein KPL71_026593 [Citrus sinensis]